MKKLVVLLALAFATAVYAQDKPQPAPQAKPEATAPAQAKTPEVPVELQRDFYKAQSEYIQAQDALNARQSAYEALLTKVGKSCGNGYQVQLDPKTGYPTCVEIPKAKTELEPAAKDTAKK